MPLRQPGYSTSYITSKYPVKNAMAEYAKRLEAKGEGFKLKSYFDGFNSMGNIAVSLGHRQLTGDDSPIKKIAEANR